MNKVTLKGHVTKVERTAEIFNQAGRAALHRYEVQVRVEGHILSFDLDKVSVPKGPLMETTPVTVEVTFPDDWEVS